MEFRRFTLINPDNEQALIALIGNKGLSRQDLELILGTLKSEAVTILKLNHAYGVSPIAYDTPPIVH